MTLSFKVIKVIVSLFLSLPFSSLSRSISFVCKINRKVETKERTKNYNVNEQTIQNNGNYNYKLISDIRYKYEMLLFKRQWFTR